MTELALHGLSSGQPAVRRVLLPPGTPPIQRDVALAAPAGVLIGDLVASGEGVGEVGCISGTF